MVLVIKRLILDKRNISHIAEHYITVDELEEVISHYFYTENTKQKRKLIIGETKDGRIIEIPLVGKGGGRYYPVTAYDARQKKAQLYLSAKAKQEGG